MRPLHSRTLPTKVISYALSPINYVLGVEEQPKDGSAAARRFVNKFEAEVGQAGRAKTPTGAAAFFFLGCLGLTHRPRFIVVHVGFDYICSEVHPDVPRLLSTCFDTHMTTTNVQSYPPLDRPSCRGRRCCILTSHQSAGPTTAGTV